MVETQSLWFYFLFATIPAIIVCIICYFLLKKFLDNQEKLSILEMQKQNAKKTLPLKLQAYERLALLFERIDIPTLIAKIKTKKMSSGDLQSALMITIQQEFEHNVAQQIYISDKLWEIVKLVKMDIFNQLNEVMIKVAFTEDVDTYSNALIEHFSKKESNPVSKALFAIKQEAKLHL